MRQPLLRLRPTTKVIERLFILGMQFTSKSRSRCVVLNPVGGRRHNNGVLHSKLLLKGSEMARMMCSFIQVDIFIGWETQQQGSQIVGR